MWLVSLFAGNCSSGFWTEDFPVGFLFAFEELLLFLELKLPEMLVELELLEVGSEGPKVGLEEPGGTI